MHADWLVKQNHSNRANWITYRLGVNICERTYFVAVLVAKFAAKEEAARSDFAYTFAAASAPSVRLHLHGEEYRAFKKLAIMSADLPFSRSLVFSSYYFKLWWQNNAPRLSLCLAMRSRECRLRGISYTLPRLNDARARLRRPVLPCRQILKDEET